MWIKNHNPFRYFKTSPEIIRLAVLGVLRSVVSALLNHAGGSVTDIYTRANLIEQKRDAVERLGCLFVGVGEEEKNMDRVVYLDSARI